ncbi:SLC13 family permease [Candidatus Chloroploca asiatica]|uniref:Sodium-dependent dicarboxylate transporter SdcS n=1 Tax=Candidatus Chloroploca asiatica TaxID=1506545 RepID=A0A2H3L9K2_9CHLR|nr:DASS family sodium-coupled anion symporter [Candidatus Chloroploca asiatica]PDW00016.1 anion transporter [Candidatus Chloroploca asiatica]
MAQISASMRVGPIATSAYTPARLIGLILGPLLFALVLFLPTPAGMSPEGQKVAATTFWIAIWWMTEAIPIPVTSLLPLVLLPLTGALSPAELSPGYANPLIFVFLGGFMIALALERWSLHRRIALRIITVVGCSPTRIVLGFMIATGFLSMWISNTATAMMMVPMGTAVILQFTDLLKRDGKAVEQDTGSRLGFGTALMLGIAYSASIGGIATLVGTPPNIVLAAAASELLGYQITFAEWMLVGVPFATVGLLATWFYLTRIAYKASNQEIPGGLDVVRGELSQLGPMSYAERAVLVVFGAVALAWIVQPFLLAPVFPMVNDAVIALIGAVVLFALPARNQEGAPTFLLTWEDAKKLPWGVVLLFGGGLALADAFKKSGLVDWMGGSLSAFSSLPNLFLLVVVVAMVIFLTEITSNTATATMLMPVMVALGMAAGMHPLLLMAPAAIAASCAFMLPVATPPNAIVFGSGAVTVPQMARAGLWLNLASIALISVIGYWLMPFMWGL